MSGWLCDGHGYWMHLDHGIVVASEARKLGAPVPADEADPDEPGGCFVDEEGSGEECPF